MQRLERPIYNLLKEEPFFAHFLLGCRIKFDDPKIDIAGVSVTKGDIVFYFNANKFFNFTMPEQVAVIKHEVLHLLLEHCGARMVGLEYNMAINIAMDCAINQHIQNLPSMAVHLPAVEKLVGHALLPHETWEYYYDKLKQKIKSQDNKPHDHDIMHGSGTDDHGEREQRRATIQAAANKATAAAAGNVSEHVRTLLGDLNRAAKLPWKQLLSNFVSSARSVKNKSTRMKPNRRFGLEQPGRKKIRELVLGVVVDSSGSVSDQAYAAFMTEISSIIKNTSITYLMHADCAVQKIVTIRNGKANAKDLTERHGRGGTAYQPAISKCTELGVDAIIYFGDMDSADTPTDPRIPFLWARVGKSNPPGDFGRIIDIEA